jgi:hypothetical protein
MELLNQGYSKFNGKCKVLKEVDITEVPCESDSKVDIFL